ncbi:hypothetical protein GJ744_009043 [Endocarpon pusillum]|uniref:Elongation factor 1 alpha-like protein n=1 Tax=Endocarpon pusillum TaxID=364733 RepID=A0A8H7AK97_9EURO|nr:hypothetical protein GJ744_009043 [Endocarpon pusillum]
MSKHRIKSVALEDDYADDYYEDDEDQSGYVEEDGMTAEDQERLRVATVQARNTLGQGFTSITDKEIQDALWHYYYDISKSVSYLKNKHTPSQSKQDKTRPAKTGSQLAVHHQAVKEPNIHHLLPSTAKDFFWDSPWLNIPFHRQAEIRIEPVFPRLGLLGGSSTGEGKMSKIAALAAKRRLKEKENEKQRGAATHTSGLPEDTASGLSKLRIATSHTLYPHKEHPLRSRHDLQSASRIDQTQETPPKGDALPPSRQQGKDKRTEDNHQLNGSQSGANVADMRAKPSMFARTLMISCDTALPLSSRPPTLLPEPVISSFDFLKPSPDDIVLKAQNFKGSKTSTSSKQQKPAKAKESITNSMENLSVVEPETIKSKNLDVLAEYKKVERKNAANFVVIGHVDSGKSTLMGRLLFDLKAIDERTMQNYKEEAEKMGRGSFAFAWVLDQGTEERARGVTIDIATHKFQTERTSFTILDAPGHRDFVPNMIGGASQADFAVLVIDASPSAFEAGLRGQTKEHALLVRSMGLAKIVVAVNKMDRTDWSKERFQDIKQQMLAFLTTAGFKSENISFVPCSGLQGDNILTRSRAPQAAWYNGPTLVEELDTPEPVNHALEKPLRMTLDDTFHDSVQNPFSVSGRIEAGSLQVGDQIVVMPSGIKAFIRSIRVDDEPSDWAVAGQNVILSLSITEADFDQINIGNMLCNPAFPVENVSSFTAKVLAFDHLMPMPLDVHKGRLHIPGRISRLAAVLNKVDDSVVKKKPQVVHPGSIARIVVELDEPAPIEAGRIILRANGETVAAGHLE